MNEDSKFPIINVSTRIGEQGITIIKDIIEKNLKWLFRQNHLEHDFGIDGYMDVISEKGQVTGKSIAFQLKTGTSFFNEENEIGYVFRGESKHLNYYLNLDIPIIIIILNNISKVAYWEIFNASKTEKAGNSWKLTIPKNQKLNFSSKSELLKHIGPITDFTSQLENDWKINKLLKAGNNRVLFRIPKQDIQQKNYDFLITALNRIQATKDLILHLKGRVDISFDDYEDDNRELYEIPEVKNWIKELYKLSNCWPYMMAMDEHSGFMKVLFISHISSIEKKLIGKGYNVEFEPKVMWPFIEEMYLKLNGYCQENSLSLKTNKEISGKIISYYSGGKIKL
jgi:hypothetical protein